MGITAKGFGMGTFNMELVPLSEFLSRWNLAEKILSLLKVTDLIVVVVVSSESELQLSCKSMVQWTAKLK